MAQLTDDCFAFGGALMRFDEALELLARRVAPAVGIETVPLRAADRRVLAEDVTATRDVPPHDNAAVDGYAVRHGDLDPKGESRLPLAGRTAAGHPLDHPATPGHAVRVFTGAAMPEGLDTIFMQEDCREESAEDGAVRVVLPAGLAAGANRRKRGEDVAAGAVILTRGMRLRPQDVGLAASVGRRALAVHRPLRAAVFSTGDEIRDPGEATPPGCVYDANRYTLMALLEGLGCAVTDLGILRDDAATVRAALAKAAATHGVIVTSGGMSVGEEDHVRAAVEALGSLHFWRLAIKPGRPIALGRIRRGGAAEGEGEAVPFIGLPGNPVAMMVTFLRIARPVVLRLMGATDTTPHLFRVRADFEHRKKPARREWVRARLAIDGEGRLVARKFPHAGAGILSSLVAADGLVELPEALTRLRPGSTVDFLPFSEVVG